MKDWYTIDLDTDATAWAVTDAEITNFIKLPSTITADADLITDIKKAATKAAQRWMNRTIATTVYTMTLDTTPDLIEFPLGYLQSVTAPNIYAEDGTTTAQTSKYHTQTGENGRIWLKVGQSWTTTSRDFQIMEIDFVSGYLTTGSGHPLVPSDMKIGLLQWCTYEYFNRSGKMTEQAEKALKQAKMTLAPFKIYKPK